MSEKDNRGRNRTQPQEIVVQPEGDNDDQQADERVERIVREERPVREEHPVEEAPVQEQQAEAPEESQAPEEPAVVESTARPVSLDFFAATNSWRIAEDGSRVEAAELMGGFVYQMRQRGRLAGTEESFREAFEAFIVS